MTVALLFRHKDTEYYGPMTPHAYGLMTGSAMRNVPVSILLASTYAYQRLPGKPPYAGVDPLYDRAIDLLKVRYKAATRYISHIMP